MAWSRPKNAMLINPAESVEALFSFRAALQWTGGNMPA